MLSAAVFGKTMHMSRHVCSHDKIATHASRNPDALAIVAPARPPLTYGQLHQQVKAVVETLNHLGIGRNDRVALVLPNGPELAVAFVAIAAGATCAPLNPAYRKEEFCFYLSDLKATALILQSGVVSAAQDAARELDIPVIRLSPLLQAEAGVFTLQGSQRLFAARPGLCCPDDVALVLHTSGTTARPKIVPLTQSNLGNSADNVRDSLQLHPTDRCLNVMPLFHIHGLVGALLSSLSAGGSVVCTPGFAAQNFFGWIEEHRPTWYTAVPTIHQAVLAEAPNHRDVISRCPLRLLRSSSSALPPSVMKELEALFSAPVIEAYGMTEASHQMASNPLPPRTRKPGSVGLAAGPEVAIMDEAGELVPAGTPGEIVIRGDNVTAGYANNPTANAAAFTKGWFRTGDQGLLDGEGYLFITGRLKELINRGGEKVSPREVDEAILDHPAVAQVVTFAMPHPKLGEEIAAAVVLRPGKAATEREIREFAGTRLAHFKVPRQVVVVDDLPKGPSGKLQRIGLAEKLALALKPDFAPPETAVEQSLAQIWTEVLGAGKVGLHDNFFALGGDSLLATQVLSRVSKLFRVELPVLAPFQEPTLAGLAAMITENVCRGAEARAGGDLLADVEGLSEEEALRLLAEETQQA